MFICFGNLFLILGNKKFKNNEEKTYLIPLKPFLLGNITQKIICERKEKTNPLFKIYFSFFSSNTNLLLKGLKSFSLFEDYMKSSKFNSLKAIFFISSFKLIVISFKLDNIIKSTIIINYPNIYLDFCMYCFYKGLYLLSLKNYNFVVPASFILVKDEIYFLIVLITKS